MHEKYSPIKFGWKIPIIFVLFIFGLDKCCAQDFEMACPENIPIFREKIGSMPGWSISTEEISHELDVITVADEEYYNLRGEEKDQNNGDFFIHWNLSGIRGRAISGDYSLYVKCNYQNSNAFLFQKIPDDINKCDYIFRADINLRKLEKLKCYK